MIPALLAAPIAEGVLGQLIGALVPHSNISASADPTFSAQLAQAAASPAQAAAPATTSTGTLTAGQWSQMGDADKLSWAHGLAGRHVNATDETGRTFSGVVGGVQNNGGALSINIGGHLVSLSQLKQITWSPSLQAA